MKGLIFTYVLTYGGAVLSLLNPFHGLLIYVAFAILRPESLWSWSVPPGSYSRIVALALLAGWSLHGFGNWNFGAARPFAVALLGYWLWIIVWWMIVFSKSRYCAALGSSPFSSR